MKRVLSSLVTTIFVVVLTVMSLTSTQTVNAQNVVCTPPVDFYRFIVNNSQLGTLLTTNYQEGVNLNFAYYPFPNGAGKIAVPPGPGYTPVSGQGLIPLYRYKIVQSGRIYYGYFNAPAGPNGGYTFEGVPGYVLPGYGQYGGVALQAYYSQTKGYFYTADTETPIGYPYYYGFAYHGSPAYMPNGSSYCWNPPPPQCSDPVGEQNCYDNGGSWNPSNCTCHIDPNPCRQAAPDKGVKLSDKEQQERPVMPCRPAAQPPVKVE